MVEAFKATLMIGHSSPAGPAGQDGAEVPGSDRWLLNTTMMDQGRAGSPALPPDPNQEQTVVRSSLTKSVSVSTCRSLHLCISGQDKSEAACIIQQQISSDDVLCRTLWQWATEGLPSQACFSTFSQSHHPGPYLSPCTELNMTMASAPITHQISSLASVFFFLQLFPDTAYHETAWASRWAQWREIIAWVTLLPKR